MSTVAAALLAGAFAVIGALLASRFERKRWLRDARFQAYSDFIQRVDASLYKEYDAGSTTWDEIFESLTGPYSQILLLGTSRVVEAADALSRIALPLPEEPEPSLEVVREARAAFLGRAVTALHHRGAASSRWLLDRQ